MGLTPIPDPVPGRRVVTLPSGLTVLLQEVRQYPVVHFNMFVRTGLRDESPPEWGMSHFLEHMVFNGNADFSREAYTRALFEIGAEDNAMTREDLTNYYLLATSAHFRKGLKMLRALVTSPVLDEDEFSKEREVIKEEISLYKDEPGPTIAEDTEIALYRHLGYNHPILGTIESLDAMTPQALRDYYDAHYVPGNALLVVIGDFDTENALRLIETEFSDFNGMTALRPPVFRDDDQTEPCIILKSSDIDATYVAVNFKAPPLRSMETFALDILMEALGGCRSSRLTARLFEELNLVTAIDAVNRSYMDASTLSIDFDLASFEHLQLVLDEIFAILSDVIKNGLADDEIVRAKTRIQADRIFRNGEFMDLSEFLGANIMLADQSFADLYLDRITSVTPGQIRDVALKYLRPDRMAIGIYFPSNEDAPVISTEKLIPADTPESKPDPPHGKITTSYKAAFSPGKTLGPVIRDTLPNGVTWVYRHCPINPSVAIDLYLRGGLAFETWDTNGVAELMHRALWKGTREKSVDVLNLAIDSYGAGIDTGARQDYMFLRSIFLSRDFEPGLSLVSDMLLDPAFPDDEIEKVKDEVLGAIIMSSDDIAQVAEDGLRLEIFGPDHPYGRPVIGRSETVSALTPRSVREFHKKIAVPENLLVVIVGDIPETDVRALVADKFGHLQPSGSKIPLLLPPQSITGQKILKIPREKSQVKIAMGSPGPSVFDPGFPAAMMMHTILGGTTFSRLFQVLREERALAYEIYTDFSFGKYPGLLNAYIGTAPENLDAAIAGIRDEYRKFCEQGPTAREIKGVREWLRGHSLVWKQGARQLALNIGINEATGLPHDWDEKILDAYKKISDTDITDAARRYADPDNIIISVCGPV